MRTETAKRCVEEINRFLKAWEDFQVRAAEYAALPDTDYRHTEHVRDWLAYTPWIGKERSALRRASLDLSNALADLRQGR